VKRREFITLLGGATVWPLAAWAQPSQPKRRIGALMNITPDSPEAPGRVGALAQGLAERGWTIGGNIQVDYRWYAADADVCRKYADELVALAPDIFFATGTLAAAAFQRTAGATPIVFAVVTDPIGAGLVDSLAKPGGNLTGFMLFEYGTNCSGRSCLTSSERVFSGIAQILPRQRNLEPSKPQDRHREWR
jgi:putative tryptophan/tyrosine transport system substrate-binding protein